jgi:antitoxin (DNA-binding transcriptional repressor) of toxin-antitoxin stability system
MANELNIALAKSGLTVTAQPYQNGAAVGSAISCPETGSSGFYSGNMTGTAGTYQVAFLASSANVGSGSIVWDGTAEVAFSTLTAAQVNAEADTALADVGLTNTVTGRIDATVSSRLAPSGTLATVTTLTNAPTVPTAAAIATQVRSELSVELGRVDAAVSSRATAANIPAADITAIKSKTDALPASPAATGDIPTAAQNASAVWSKPANELTVADSIGERAKQQSTVAITGAQLAAALS